MYSEGHRRPQNLQMHLRFHRCNRYFQRHLPVLKVISFLSLYSEFPNLLEKITQHGKFQEDFKIECNRKGKDNARLTFVSSVDDVFHDSGPVDGLFQDGFIGGVIVTPHNDLIKYRYVHVVNGIVQISGIRRYLKEKPILIVMKIQRTVQ